MEKYIRISTTSGLGYSDSNAWIVESTKEEMSKKIRDISFELIKDIDAMVKVVDDKAIIETGDDSSMEAFTIYNEEFAIELNPEINNYTLIDSYEDLTDRLFDIKNDRDVSDRDKDMATVKDCDGYIFSQAGQDNSSSIILIFGNIIPIEKRLNIAIDAINDAISTIEEWDIDNSETGLTSQLKNTLKTIS